MVLAALYGVDKFYGDQVVLEHAALELTAGSRLALIGRNGAGKSTLLRLLMEREEPDGGRVFIRTNVHVAMLSQDPHFAAGATVHDVAEAAFGELDAMEQTLQGFEQSGLDDPTTYERWETLHDTFTRRGGYERRARRDAVLDALGFRGREHEGAAHLSGGEKTRLGLAQLLMTQPDVLLLDEPTNHLDMAMREWLEGYLGRYPGGVVLVSHDRAFLDGAATATAEIALGTLRTFDDIPTRYREHREEQLRIEAATRANQQKEYDRLEQAATQMKKWAGQNAKLHRRAKSMEGRLERYAQEMVAETESDDRSVRFRFAHAVSNADVVLQASNLSKSFGDTTLFDDVTLTVRQDERIALVGPNGAGKSTFLKTLLGDMPSDDPSAALQFGARVRVGYYDQELRGVDPDLTLIEEMIRMVGDVEAHNLLGRFLFPYDAQYKKIADLSGGERARLALLKLSLHEYSLLVLDEPTNHLDVEMIETLEAALDAFDGTLIVVSHDRRFIERIATRVWELRNGDLIDFEGDWNFFLRKQRERRAALDDADAKESAERRAERQKTSDAHAPQAPKLPSRWKLERRLEALEAQIDDLETTLAELNDKLANPEALNGEDFGELGELGAQHADVEATLLSVMAEWEETSEMLSAKEALS